MLSRKDTKQQRPPTSIPHPERVRTPPWFHFLAELGTKIQSGDASPAVCTAHQPLVPDMTHPGKGRCVLGGGKGGAQREEQRQRTAQLEGGPGEVSRPAVTQRESRSS